MYWTSWRVYKQWTLYLFRIPFCWFAMYRPLCKLLSPGRLPFCIGSPSWPLSLGAIVGISASFIYPSTELKDGPNFVNSEAPNPPNPNPPKWQGGFQLNPLVAAVAIAAVPAFPVANHEIKARFGRPCWFFKRSFLLVVVFFFTVSFLGFIQKYEGEVIDCLDGKVAWKRLNWMTFCLLVVTVESSLRFKDMP